MYVKAIFLSIEMYAFTFKEQLFLKINIHIKEKGSQLYIEQFGSRLFINFLHTALKYYFIRVQFKLDTSQM